VGRRRRRSDRQSGFSGYEDKAALKGFGGYEPVEPTPTFGVPEPPRPSVTPTSPTRSVTHGLDPGRPSSLPKAPDVRLGRQRTAPPSRRPQVFGCGCLVLVIMLIVAGGVLSRQSRESTSSDEAVSASVAPTPDASPPETRVLVPELIEGWQPVVQRDGVYAYDVPPEWEPRPTVVHGWEGDDPLTLATSAFVGIGACDAEGLAERGSSGVTMGEAPPAAEASERAQQLARLAYTPEGGRRPDVEVIEQHPVEVAVGESGTEAELVLVEVTVSDGGECLPERALVGALAFGTAGQSVVLLAHDGQDDSGSTSKEELVTVLTSLRTVPEDDRETTVVTPTR
jgi:hypothetical protein